jgi:hypothetical protein
VPGQIMQNQKAAQEKAAQHRANKSQIVDWQRLYLLYFNGIRSIITL